jgi:nicotinamidase-related amidase
MERVLRLPDHFVPNRVSEVWRVPYEQRAREAAEWAAEHDLQAAARDETRVCLLAVDVQNTFCTPGFELFVGGRSGTGAVDDNRRLCAFVYGNLGRITQIVPTLDTHQAMQIFHAAFLVDAAGAHPDPYTLVSAADVEAGRWRVSPEACEALGIEPDYAQRHLETYTRALEAGGKLTLTIWPYHAMLGGIGHALVSAVEETIFFHSIARASQADFQIKGRDPLTEHYSALGPEVGGETNRALVERLATFDAIVVAGQAKSHCVAWTVEELLGEAPELASRLYLLEDCSSAVVVPGVVDYTEDADRGYARFAEAGAHVVRSTEPIDSWPGVLGAAGASL